MSAPFMQLYVADYLGDTQHLTAEQHGAYLLLLMTMWRHGGSLPDDPAMLGRIARVSPRRWHLIQAEVMAFFDHEDGRITQKRLVEEYQKAVLKSEKRSASGKLGGEAKSLKSRDTAVANAKQMPQHSSDIRTREDIIGASAPQEPASRDHFEEFWQAYPKRIGANPKKPAKAKFEKLCRDGEDPDRLIAAARRLATEHPKPSPYVPQAVTWLGQERHRDDEAASVPSVDDDQWRKRLQFGRDEHIWFEAKWGPRPGANGCAVPSRLIRNGDGDGWRNRSRSALA